MTGLAEMAMAAATVALPVNTDRAVYGSCRVCRRHNFGNGGGNSAAKLESQCCAQPAGSLPAPSQRSENRAADCCSDNSKLHNLVKQQAEANKLAKRAIT